MQRRQRLHQFNIKHTTKARDSFELKEAIRAHLPANKRILAFTNAITMSRTIMDKFNEQQIVAAVRATSAMCFFNHIMDIEYCDAVVCAMQMAHDQNGQLTDSDLSFINDLMP